MRKKNSRTRDMNAKPLGENIDDWLNDYGGDSYIISQESTKSVISGDIAIVKYDKQHFLEVIVRELIESGLQVWKCPEKINQMCYG